MKDDDVTGCGISRIWLTRDDDPFKSACAVHDAAYTTGSLEQEIFSRKQVDSLLLHNMLAVSNTPMLKAKAYLFYGIVRTLGFMWWEGTR